MIFPGLEGQPCGYLNLTLCGRRLLCEDPELRHKVRHGQNPLLDPTLCQEMVEREHEELGLAFSYGGWLEDRSTLWRGSYLDKNRAYLHLGVDFNAPIGTMISASHTMTVVDISDDHPDPHGWGRRIIAELVDEPVTLVYGHVDNITCEVGEEVRAGALFADIAPPSHNGGWYPHLHVQAITREAWERHYKLHPLHSLDGYGCLTDRADWARTFPDPMRYIRIS